MRRANVIVALFCAATLEATAQSTPPPALLAATASIVARVHRTLINPNTGLHATCVVVHEDGRFRFENSQQDIQLGPAGRPTIKIYVDTLPEPLLKQLREIVDDQALLEIKSPVHNDQILNGVDQISATVPRKNGVQNFTFLDPDSRKPFDKALKPLLEWFRDVQKDIQKRKLQPQKGTVSNRCAD
jgi:hypothetical protein